MLENFDFNWFLTTPGILTILGCLLIIISIIIFISSLVGGKKNKDKDPVLNVQTIEENKTSPEVQTEQATSVQGTPEAVQPLEQVVEQPTVQASVEPVVVAPEVPAAPVPTQETVQVPVEPVQKVEVATPQVTPEVAVQTNQETQVAPEVPAAPVPIQETVQVPVEPVQKVEVATPQVTPEVKETVNTPIEITPESVNVTPSTQPETNFTGINIEPTIMPTEKPVNEQPKVIYGGADPLAGTGIIQTVTQNINEKKDEIESL